MAALFFGGSSLPAIGATNDIALVELGHPTDLTIPGPNPRFTLFVPVYPQLDGIRIRIPLRFSPVIDRRSTISVAVNDRIVSTTTVGAMGTTPVVDQILEVPTGARAAMQVSITGHFFEKGDVCFDPDTSGFWMTVSRFGSLIVTTSERRRFIRDFLRDYGGRIDVVAPPSLGNALRYQAVRLAYFLHQSNRWRQTTVTLVDRPGADARNVVLGDFPQSLEMRGRDLYVNRDGVALLQQQFDGMLLTGSVGTPATDRPNADPAFRQTFEQAGFSSQTLSGTGEMPFMVPLGFGRVGGMPDGLQLHILLTRRSSRRTARLSRS